MNITRTLISLEWKKFRRSSFFTRGLIFTIFLILGALYFAGMFGFFGAAAFYILDKSFDTDPLVLVNNYLIYWFLLDLIIRYFFQSLPTLQIKPLLTFDIKRSKIIHVLIGKTGFSFFNFLPLFFFVPFSIVLLIEGYPPLNVVCWFFSMLFFNLAINFLNFLINKTNSLFYVVIGILAFFIALEYFQVYQFSETAGQFFNTIYTKFYALAIPFLLMVLLYCRVYKMLRSQFYLDGALKQETKVASTSDMSWLNRFGSLAPFLKNDLKLIWRNKRPKKILWTSFFFLFYGLIFLTVDLYKDSEVMLVFASIFVTGGFLITFGQLVPSWDSEYYKLLMSQNIRYRKYLESKWYLMVFATVISFILITPYVFFGIKTYALFAAGAVFNVGYATFINLWSGVYNKKPVELNSKSSALSNTQNFNLTQMLLAIPKLVAPIVIFYIFDLFFGFYAGALALAVVGILGLLMKNFLLGKIENLYQQHKYKMIAAFEEKS